jgi:flagellar hook-basal body complex protein FliE
MEAKLLQLEQKVNELEDSQSPDLYASVLKDYQGCVHAFENIGKNNSKNFIVTQENFASLVKQCTDSQTELETMVQIKNDLLQYIDTELETLENQTPTIH